MQGRTACGGISVPPWSSTSLRGGCATAGFKVTTVRNVTDIDDKILAKSVESAQPTYTGEHPNEQWWALAYRYEKVFARAYATLGIDPPTYEPRATGHIPEMFELIQRLIDRGHAYPALDDSGDVYFDVRSWGTVWRAHPPGVDDMQDSADADPRGKRDPRDFALWKGYKEGEPLTAAWDSPWGSRSSRLASGMLRDGG